MVDHAFTHLPTIHWDDGMFFYEYSDGRPEPRVPTVRPHGWLTEPSEQRIVSLIRRKGYAFDGSPQFWTNGVGMAAWLVPASGGVKNEDWKYVYGDTLAELTASILKLPDISSPEHECAFSPVATVGEPRRCVTCGRDGGW